MSIIENPLIAELLANKAGLYSADGFAGRIVISMKTNSLPSLEDLFGIDIDALYMPNLDNDEKADENIRDLFFESQGIGEITLSGRRVLFLELTEEDKPIYVAGLVVYSPPTEIEVDDKQNDENTEDNADEEDEPTLNAKFYVLAVSIAHSAFLTALGECFSNIDNVPDSHLEFAPSEEDFEYDDEDDDEDEDEDE